MIESPVLIQFVAERLHRNLLIFLKGRFGPLPADIEEALGGSSMSRSSTNWRTSPPIVPTSTPSAPPCRSDSNSAPGNRWRIVPVAG